MIYLFRIDKFTDVFEIKLDDGSIIKSGSEIQLKSGSDRLIAISFCHKSKSIKFSKKGTEEVGHLSIFKKYKFQLGIYFI